MTNLTPAKKISKINSLLDRRVDRDGRAVDEALGPAHVQTALAQTLADPERGVVELFA